MSDFTELFEVSSEQAVKFFFKHLKGEVLTKEDFVEKMYIASVLAHFAQTPRGDPVSISLGNLSEVFNTYILPEFGGDESRIMTDPEILETAGSQTLFLVGFFRDQVGRRHDPDWYDQLGSSFFERASDRLFVKQKKKSDLLRRVAFNFPAWATNCQDMSRTLREERYVLRLD